MNYRITSALMLLFLASSEAFSTVSRADSFLGSSTRSHSQFEQKQAQFRQNVFGSASNRAAPSTSLNMAATPVVGAIAGALTGGFFAGGLHAIAGECFIPSSSSTPFYSYLRSSHRTRDRPPPRVHRCEDVKKSSRRRIS
jgi:hypothetical protein